MNLPASTQTFELDTGSASGQTAPALLQEDMARMFRLIGVQYVRASVVHLASRAYQAGWSITDDGAVTESPADRGGDSIFPGAATTLGQLAQVSVEETLLQKLSPRRWAFAWRIDETHAVVTEAQYRDRRDAVSDIDTAAVRLVCNASIRNSLDLSQKQAELADEPAAPLLVWPQVERRAQAAPARTGRLLPAVLIACAALCGWVALVAAPAAQAAAEAQQAEVARLQKTGDSTLAQWLSTAMATGDYGETQDELSLFSSLGYFQRAVVTNAKGKVVAMSGPVESVRIGDPIDPAFTAASRSIDLALGSERHGQLHMVGGSAVTAAPSFLGLRVVAGLGFVAALIAAGLLLMRRRRR